MFSRRSSRTNRRNIGNAAQGGGSVLQMDLGVISWDAWHRLETAELQVSNTFVNEASPDSNATRYGYRWPVRHDGTTYLYTAGIDAAQAQANFDDQLLWQYENKLLRRDFTWYPTAEVLALGEAGERESAKIWRAGFDLYNVSPYKNRIKFTLILQSAHAAWDGTLADETWDWGNFEPLGIPYWISLMRDPQYARTPDGHPIVFFFQSSSGASWDQTHMGILRDAIADAGLPTMYEVQQNGNATLANQLAHHAVSTYGPSGAILSAAHHPWTDQAAEDAGNWVVGFSKQTVHGITFGCDRRARGGENANWADRATYSEAEAHLIAAVADMDARPTKAPYRIAQIYAVTELDEGLFNTIPAAQDRVVYDSSPELEAIKNVQTGLLPATWTDRYASWSSHADLTRTGTWTYTRDLSTADSQGRTSYEFSHEQSVTADDSIALAPAGNSTGFSIHGSRSSSRGIMEIFVDDVSQGNVDMYSATTTRNETLYSVTGLAPGAHSIELVVTGTKNASSSAVTIAIDEIRAFMTR